MSYKKYDQSNTQYDDLGYIYNAITNKLSYVTDDAGMSGVLGTDIDAGQAVNNYTYDASGHLVKLSRFFAAGNITLDKNGKVIGFSNNSGHYKTGQQGLDNLQQSLK